MRNSDVYKLLAHREAKERSRRAAKMALIELMWMVIPMMIVMAVVVLSGRQ